jgi:hypothetical protein
MGAPGLRQEDIVTTRLAVLFLLAMTGVFVAIGLVAASLGPFVLPGYLVGVTVFVALLGRRARTQRATAVHDSGRTCQCCTSTVFDPIEIR